MTAFHNTVTLLKQNVTVTGGVMMKKILAVAILALSCAASARADCTSDQLLHRTELGTGDVLQR